MFRHQAGVGWHRIMAQADRIQSWRDTAQNHFVTDAGQQPRLSSRAAEFAGFLGRVFLLAAASTSCTVRKALSTRPAARPAGAPGCCVAHSAHQAVNEGSLSIRRAARARMISSRIIYDRLFAMMPLVPAGDMAKVNRPHRAVCCRLVCCDTLFHSIALFGVRKPASQPAGRTTPLTSSLRKTPALRELIFA